MTMFPLASKRVALHLSYITTMLWVLSLGLVSARPASATPRNNPNAYVGNLDDRTISVIDTRTNKVVATIPDVPGVSFPAAEAVSPDGKRLYVGNAFFANVMVIDTDTNEIIATITVPRNADALAVTPDGKRVYVANDVDSVYVIDTAANAVVFTITGLSSPRDVAADPDNHHVFVSNRTGSTVSVINTDTNTVTHTIPVGMFPGRLVVAPDGERVYVTSVGSGSGEIDVISTESNTVIDTIQVRFAASLAITPNGRKLFATTNIDTIVVVDIPENKIETTITVESGSTTDVAVGRIGHRVYVTNEGRGTVLVISAANDRVEATIPVGRAPSPVATQPARNNRFKNVDDNQDDRH